MLAGTSTRLLDLTCGVFLLTAVLVLWRRELVALVRVLAVQGVALAALVVILDTGEHSAELLALAVLIVALRGWALPRLMRRVLADLDPGREARPRVDVASSLLAAAALTLLAYAAARPLTDLDPSPATQTVPVGLAVVLIAFFALVTRRRALSQVASFLMLDNGIAATAFLATDGMPLIVELGVSFDLLLAVLVLHLLARRMRAAFGDTDLNDLRELHG